MRRRMTKLAAFAQARWRTAALGFGVVCALGFVGFGALMIHYTVAMPNPMAMSRDGAATPAIRVYARDGSLLGMRGPGNVHVPIESLPPHTVEAVLATEDRRFFEHWGFDPTGLARAMFANLRAGRFAQGGSTLTQQLAKNLFLSPERTLTRKLEEVALAVWLEVRLSKKEILELYLNRVYFGGGAYGIEAASQRYFGKPAPKMTLAESAVIAGLLKAPSRFSPATNPQAARARGLVVLAKMSDAGFITVDEHRDALSEQVRFAVAKTNTAQGAADYAVDYVIDSLPDIVGKLEGDDVAVLTTIDANLQRRAGDIVQRHMSRSGPKLHAGQAAVALMENDGALRALIGGKSYSESQYNRAVKSKRQPGSAFKPFVYLAALEDGATPYTVVPDAPISVAGWKPNNENGRFQGPMTLRDAMAQSVNTIAVRMYLDTAPGRVVATAKRFGIQSDLRDDASLALGTSEVSLLEITGAYAALGRDGVKVDPFVVQQVKSRSGKILYSRQRPAFTRVAGLREVSALNDMLVHVVTDGTGRKAGLPHHMAAGKTGTTQDFRDAWFVGYTAQMTAGVWVGNDDAKPMNHVTGGSLPAEIWHDLMAEAHRSLPSEGLPGTGMSGAFAYERAAAGDPAGRATDDDLAPMNAVVEVLPWLRRNVMPDWWAPRRARTPDAVPEAEPRYPSERITDEFVSKLSAGGSTSRQLRQPFVPYDQRTDLSAPLYP